MVKIFIGKVIDRRPKTAVVAVGRVMRHPVYKKTLRLTKKYHVHNPTDSAQIGETVRFKECRPISRLKKYIIIEEKSK